MTEKNKQLNEDEFIHFLIDPDALSQDKKNRIKAEYHDEIKKWQEMTGKPPDFLESRWQRIKAEFWQQADKKAGSRRLYLSLAGVTMTLLFFFLITTSRNPAVIDPDISQSITIAQSDLTEDPFEYFVDSLMPVVPITESIWFTVPAEGAQQDDIFEELILITNNL